MAMTSDVITVGTSPVALNSVGPTNVWIRNLTFDSILIGITGAGKQNYPLGGGSELRLTIAASDVVFALAQKAGQKLAVLTA